MRKNPLSTLYNAESGQAVVEYALMLSIAVGLVSVIAFGFRNSIVGLWKSFAKDISAACPTNCPGPPNVK